MGIGILIRYSATFKTEGSSDSSMMKFFLCLREERDSLN